MKSIFKILLYVFLIAGTINGISNSHTPISLKTLIPKSDIIIVGKVISSKERPRPKNTYYFSDPWVAKVEILDVIKGSKEKYFNKIIEIEFSKNIPCTGSAEYKDSLFVLSFLSIDESGVFHTISGPYGVKNLDTDGIYAFKERIIEFLKHDGFKNDSNKLIDWYIKCLSNPITSWEGAYELSPKNYYINGKDSLANKVNLSINRIDKLKKAILNIEHLQYQDIELLPLIYTEEDTCLLKYIANQIDTISYKNSLISERIIFKMTFLMKNDSLDKITNSYHELIDRYIQIRNYHSSKNQDESIFENSSLEIFKKFQKKLLELNSNKIEQKKEVNIDFNYNRTIYVILALLIIIILISRVIKKIK